MNRLEQIIDQLAELHAINPMDVSELKETIKAEIELHRCKCDLNDSKQRVSDSDSK